MVAWGRAGALGALALLAAALVPAPPLGAEPIEVIEAPTKGPKFEFASQGGGIEPGSSGTYAFTMRNRYNDSMLNVTVTVEIYRYATVEPERVVNLSQPSDGSRFLPDSPFGAPPVFAASGDLRASAAVPSLSPNSTVEVRQSVSTARSAPEGVYFTRHRVEFDYANFTVPGEALPRTGHFIMVSRGHLTDTEWASINYTDLEGSLGALNISGIVPDSSFSVKRPAPLWPLALLVGATAAAGTLALAEYLVATDPEKHGRLNRALLQLSGKWHVLRVSVAEELRARLKRRPAGK